MKSFIITVVCQNDSLQVNSHNKFNYQVWITLSVEETFNEIKRKSSDDKLSNCKINKFHKSLHKSCVSVNDDMFKDLPHSQVARFLCSKLNSLLFMKKISGVISNSFQQHSCYFLVACKFVCKNLWENFFMRICIYVCWSRFFSFLFSLSVYII